MSSETSEGRLDPGATRVRRRLLGGQPFAVALRLAIPAVMIVVLWAVALYPQQPSVAGPAGCVAGDSGLLNPTIEAAANGGNDDGFELNPSAAFADGAEYATNQDGPRDRHQYSGYGYALPDGCAVAGIEVRLDWWLADTGGNNSMRVQLSPDGGQTWSETKSDSQETTAEHTAVLGGPSDAWGRAWTAQELSDANFVLRISTHCGGPSCGSQDFFLDWVPIIVHVAPPPTPTATETPPATPTTIDTPTPTVTNTAVPTLTSTLEPAATATNTTTPTATAPPALCGAGDTGFLNPSAEAADTGGDGNGFELNPIYGFGNDSLHAENHNGAGDRHRYYDYGISIPAGCVVAGIEVRLDWWLDSRSGGNRMNVELSWDGGASWTSARADSTKTTSEHTTVLGGSSDTWGRDWTAAELSDSNLRVRLTSNSNRSARDFFLEWVPVRVFYAAPSNPCQVSIPPSTAYSVTLCIDGPAPGSQLVGDAPVSASVSVTGTNPGIRHLTFFLDGTYLLRSFEAPFNFILPSDSFVDGARTLEVEALMRDDFVSDRPTISVAFNNGVTEPPGNTNTYTPSEGSTPQPGAPFVLAAVGDGADDRSTTAQVANEIASWDPNLFLYLGDVYEKGTVSEFQNWYAPDHLYGQFRDISNPTIGNHEYENGEAPGYFNYWDNVPDFYSFDAAGWHFISLNSTSQAGPVGNGSPQFEWLEQDLIANSASCTAVFFHHPAFSIGPQGDALRMQETWALLAGNGVDLAFTGHDHNYQRWLPMDGTGALDPNGLTQFVVGTGGHSVLAFVRSDSRVAAGFDTSPGAFGALRLELNQDGAGYQFVDLDGQLLDSGSTPCTGDADTTPPTAPADLTTSAVSEPAVELSWTQATDNVGVTGYDIYRNGTLLVTAPPSTSYVDATAEQDTSYDYEIRARDAAGNVSDPSNVSSITTPAFMFGDGFELGDLSQWVLASGLIVQNDEVLDGSWAARGTATGGPGTYAREELVGEQSELFYRVDFKILSQGSNATLLKFRTAADSSILGLFVNSDGTLRYRNDVAGMSVASSTVITQGVWHDVQVRVRINGTAGETEVWFDGVRVDELSNIESLGTNLIGRIQLGENSSGRQYDIAFDNVAVDTSLIVPPSPTATPTATQTPMPSKTATPTATLPVTPTATPGGGDVLTFLPIDDAYVRADNPGANFGSSTKLQVDGSPEKRFLVKFAVSGVGTRDVVSATLRLYNVDPSSGGGEFHRVADTSWLEDLVTWDSAPPADAAVLASLGAVSTNTWYELDVTTLVTGDGDVSVLVQSGLSNGADYSSKEGGFAPELVVTLSDVSTNSAAVAFLASWWDGLWQ